MTLEVAHVSAGYNSEVSVLQDVNLVAESGAITAIVGPNGSGKSTLLRTIFGATVLHSGRVLLDGEDLTSESGVRLARRGIVYMPQSADVFAGLRVQDNLAIYAWQRRRNRSAVKARKEEVFRHFPAVHTGREYLAGSLSGGTQRQVEFGRRFMMEPAAILLDEPSAGVSPVVSDVLYEEIEKLRDLGKPVVLVDQNVDAAVKCSDIIYDMELGKVANCYRGGEVEAEEIVKAWLNAGTQGASVSGSELADNETRGGR